jgi:hypothetical protein
MEICFGLLRHIDEYPDDIILAGALPSGQFGTLAGPEYMLQSSQLAVEAAWRP